VNGQLWYGQVAGPTPSGCGRATRRVTGRS
jgi:hypothetical protein